MEISTLFDLFPHPGRLAWIGVRPGRRAPLQALEEVEARAGSGLAGDHYSGGAEGKRHVTLLQGEHLDAVAAILGQPPIDPARTRRNLVVRGINLLALHDRRFRIGPVLLEGTGYCHPCSRMEENLGPGGYNAMRGHGGITARILEGGLLRLGDAVQLEIVP